MSKKNIGNSPIVTPRTSSDISSNFTALKLWIPRKHVSSWEWAKASFIGCEPRICEPSPVERRRRGSRTAVGVRAIPSGRQQQGR